MCVFAEPHYIHPLQPYYISGARHVVKERAFEGPGRARSIHQVRRRDMAGGPGARVPPRGMRQEDMYTYTQSTPLHNATHDSLRRLSSGGGFKPTGDFD